MTYQYVEPIVMYQLTATTFDYYDWATVVIALIAACISLLAVYRMEEQAKKTEKHNRLCVRPHLTVDGDFGPQSEYIGLILKNNGIGPAILKEINIEFEGKKFDTFKLRGWSNLMDEFKEIDLNFCIHQSSHDAFIPANQELILLGLRSKDQSNKQRESFIDCVESLVVRVRYESMYGESFDGVREGYIFSLKNGNMDV